jgi:hypothetical protein
MSMTAGGNGKGGGTVRAGNLYNELKACKGIKCSIALSIIACG